MLRSTPPGCRTDADRLYRLIIAVHLPRSAHREPTDRDGTRDGKHGIRAPLRRKPSGGSRHRRYAGDGDITKEAGKVSSTPWRRSSASFRSCCRGRDRCAADCPARHGHLRQGWHDPAVLNEMNPSGVHVWSFKVPTAEERAHDFLWRHHLAHRRCRRWRSSIARTTRRSWSSWSRASSRPRSRSAATRTSTTSNCCSISRGPSSAKFFLHISKESQEERLLARAGRGREVVEALAR